jgi:membrane-associated phospholipid phosphatase
VRAVLNRAHPSFPVERASRRLGQAGLLAASAFVAIAAVLLVQGWGGFDDPIMTWVESHRHAAFTFPALALDVMGAWWAMTLLTAAAVAGLAWRGCLRMALYVSCTAIMALSLNLVLKATTGRIRPETWLPSAPSSSSFPSGHTMLATALVAALCLLAWDDRRWRWILTPAIALALMMGISRVYLAVHWPSDVLAGWALGFGIAALAGCVILRRDPPGEEGGNREANGIEIVLLDWGNTLMVDDDTQPGPMRAWPRVEAMAGAEAALRRLRPGHLIVVATNAEDSSADDVFAALSRVGLDGLVDIVATSRDLGVGKPDAAYFAAALKMAPAGQPQAAGRAVMVGDSWTNDIAGAMAAGLRTIWLNPGGLAVPPGARPPDAQISSLAELPAAVELLSVAPAR